MFDAYVIEIRDAAAGIIVRDGNRFRFCASDRKFYDLEGRSFCSPRDAEEAALRHVLNRETKKISGSRKC